MSTRIAIRFTAPGWNDPEKIFQALATEVGEDHLIALQSFGFGRVEALLDDKDLAEKLVENGLNVEGSIISVSIYKDPRRWFRVRGYPLMEDPQPILDFFSGFGKVHKMAEEAYLWNPKLKNGIKKILLHPRDPEGLPIPDIARIGEFKCQIRGNGVRKACFKCLSTTHVKKDCTETQQMAPPVVPIVNESQEMAPLKEAVAPENSLNTTPTVNTPVPKASPATSNSSDKPKKKKKKRPANSGRSSTVEESDEEDVMLSKWKKYADGRINSWRHIESVAKDILKAKEEQNAKTYADLINGNKAELYRYLDDCTRLNAFLEQTGVSGTLIRPDISAMRVIRDISSVLTTPK